MQAVLVILLLGLAGYIFLVRPKYAPSAAAPLAQGVVRS
jgi:hypothetical protein